MSAPIDIFLSVLIGASIALACRVQLRLSPQPWYATRYFAALASFEAMLLLPSAAYRYFFHPDWAFMYLFEASGNALIGAVALLVILGAGVGTFWLGNFCTRSGRDWVLIVVLVAAAAAVALISALGAQRLFLVGTHTQWQRTFGLRSISETDLLPAVLVMGLCVVISWLYILLVFVREATALSRASR